MKIVSISRRSDVPAFYSRWFLKRVHAGFCHWLNPFGGQVYRVSLAPQDVLAFVFWTRNPRPLLPHLRSLEEAGYHFYFHYTINGYPETLESHNPPIAAAVESFHELAGQIGKERVLWRYDPIVLSDQTPAAYHREQLGRLAAALAGATQRCYFSFVDFYGKTERNLAKVSRQHGLTFQRPPEEAQLDLTHELRDLASPHGISLYSCCGDHLVGAGVEKAHCIDLDVIRSLRPDVDVLLKAAPTRKECGCVETADIGAYDTCSFGCAYCYATNSRAAATARLRQHDPEDTVLWRPQSLEGVDLTQREYGSARRNRRPEDSLPGEQLILLDSD